VVQRWATHRGTDPAAADHLGLALLALVGIPVLLTDCAGLLRRRRWIRFWWYPLIPAVEAVVVTIIMLVALNGQGHAIGGLPVDPGRHRAEVGVDAPVGRQVQGRVEQLSIQLGTRQAPSTALTQDIQYRFDVLHYAYLPESWCPIT